MARPPSLGHHTVPMPTVADCLSDPAHAGPLDGATRVGRAAAGDRLVALGLWTEGDRIVRARFRATSCASLIAYAEVACAALEAGLPPAALDAQRLRASLAGVHPGHLVRADLVAAALRAATLEPEEPG
ncbi:iron-sulfur cluster assembly scaffold protein [Anaeromyxobacter sp. Fw109-5]|uniref:iron-sulfur cluster assembly scaffold protein n=1 Tax=Anaeromyxobacter sp. (strain Fw109-5) TaxID=404589 RepID=UPI001F360875|nr:iron-sulfur cluster assembly scaffold protein [Anaeromyxobacter sp. Fw109-5]